MREYSHHIYSRPHSAHNSLNSSLWSKKVASPSILIKIRKHMPLNIKRSPPIIDLIQISIFLDRTCTYRSHIHEKPVCLLRRQPPHRIVIPLTDHDSETFSAELRHRMDVVVNMQNVTLIRFIKFEFGAIGTKQYSECEIEFCVGQAIAGGEWSARLEFSRARLI